jgi:hypothetical protein
MPDQTNVVLKPSSVRHNNYRSVLLTIRTLGVCTVSDIAEKLNLSKTAIFKAVLALQEQGFVLSAGKGASTPSGGKPPETYCVNPNCRYTCSITFYHDLVIVYIHNFMTELIHQTSFPLNMGLECTPEAYADLFCQWIYQAFAQCHADPKLLCGVLFLHDREALQQDSISQLFLSSEMHHPLTLHLANKLGIPNLIHVEQPKDMRGYAELRVDDSRRNKLVVVISVLKEDVTGCVLNHGSILHGAAGTLPICPRTFPCAINAPAVAGAALLPQCCDGTSSRIFPQS